jgi:hypothetical protein
MMKRGELTTTQIVTLVILLISFAVILFFITQLDLGRTTEKEVCHNSVVARGSSVLPENSVPLNCQRTYVCISEDGSCEQMTNPNLKKVKTKEEVYEILAEEMADCWWMFGEGEINYVGKDTIPEFYCSICSQIAFDDSIYGEEGRIFEEGEFEKREFYRYLFEEEFSDGETYSQYLYGTSSFESFEGFLTSNDLEFGIVDLTNQYYVLTGMTGEINSIVGAGIGAISATIFTVATGGIGALGSIGALVAIGGVGAAGGFFLTPVVESVFGYKYIPPVLLEVNSEEFESLDCKSITTLS